MVRPREEITVSVPAGIVDVIAVLIALPGEGNERNGAEKFRELLRKTSREIERAPIVKRIPLVTPPLLWSIDLAIRCFRKIRENFRAGEIALALEEVKFRPPDELASQAAMRTERGRRDEFLPPGKHRRYALEETEVIIGDLERNPALTAHALHGRSIQTTHALSHS